MEILPDRCTTIAKKELIYAGTVGLICWLGGIVFINRKKTSDAKSVMADAAKTMLDDQVTCLQLTQETSSSQGSVVVFVRDCELIKSTLSYDFHRFVCGYFQREPVTKMATCCPSKRVLSIWQCRHK